MKNWSLKNRQLTSPLTSKKRGNVLKTSAVLSGSRTIGPDDVERSSSSSQIHLLHQQSEQGMIWPPCMHLHQVAEALWLLTFGGLVLVLEALWLP